MNFQAKYILYGGILLILTMIIMYSFSDSGGAEKFAEDLKVFREARERNFKFGEDSPIPDDKKAFFSKLNYFEANMSYKVPAKIELTNEEDYFIITTTQKEERKFLKYAALSFTLNNKKHKIYIYRALDRPFNGEYFVPFTDNSNSISTYAGGRYLNIQIDEQNLKAVIDFNKAYNPFCIYDPEFSCPIPPKENHINTEVLAGEKIWKYSNEQ